MSECFVIMPISTSAEAARTFHDDADHFRHVLDHLFTPAIELAGMKAVPPIMSGADVIHAEIIKNLEQGQLVLCDISGLNPNVFFELGIRTSLDRPVALVRDDLTTTIPFDTGIINCHSYFELTQRAEPAVEENSVEAKLDLVIAELARRPKARVSVPRAPRASVPVVGELLEPAVRYDVGDINAGEFLAVVATIADTLSARLELRALDVANRRIVLSESSFVFIDGQLDRIIGIGRDWYGFDVIIEPGTST